MKKVFIILTLSLMLTLTACAESQPSATEILDKNNGSSISEEADGSGVVSSENTSTEQNESIGNTDTNNTQNAEASGSSEKSENKSEDDAEKNDQSSEESKPTPVIGTEVGNLIADVTLTTMDGGAITLSELKCKIVILNIWATWCPPCKAELPDFDRIASEYKDKVVIIAADADAGQGNAKSYVQQNFAKTDIIFAYDTPTYDAYRVAGGDGYVPYTAIIDKDGVIVYSDSGALSYEQLKQIIDNL